LCYIIEHGSNGETYNIGGGNERQNIEITKLILSILGEDESLIQPVRDRQGHDRRYALDGEKLARLGWKPQYGGTTAFEQAMEKTVNWYHKNEQWWRPLKSGEFLDYYKQHYQLELSEKRAE